MLEEREEQLSFDRSFSTDSDQVRLPLWPKRKNHVEDASYAALERDRRSRTEGGGEERRDDEKKKEKRNRGDEGRNVVGGCESVEHRNSINVEMGDFATVFWVVQSLVAKHEGARSGCWSITWHDGESGRSRKGRRVLYIYIYTRWTRVRAGDAREGGLWRGARFEKRRERGRGKEGEGHTGGN